LENEEISNASGVGMNIKQEITCLNGVRNGNANRSGFGLTGKTVKMGMRVLRK
jgi:hypothetical protein